MADIYVRRRCAVVSRTAMNGFSADLTWMAGIGSLLWLVDYALELSSGFQLDRTYNQLVSGGLKGTGSETVVCQKAWLSWQGAQTGLTGWTDSRA